MKIADVQAVGTLHSVRLGPSTYRVVRLPLVGRLVETSWHTFEGALEAVSTRRLAAGWALAARSPHTIVYFPIAEATTKDGRIHEALRYRTESPSLDMVLLHHLLQFPASRWKQVRERLGRGTPYKATLPAGAYQPIQRPEWQHWQGRQGLDTLRFDIAADTAVVTGSRLSFADELDLMRQLVEDIPAEYAGRPSSRPGIEIGIDTLYFEWLPDAGRLTGAA